MEMLRRSMIIHSRRLRIRVAALRVPDMARYFTIVLMWAAMLLLLAAIARADFDDQGAGARATAMGNSFVALADDAFGMYYNPAGLGFIRTAQIGADFGRLHYTLTDESKLMSGFMGIVFPMIRVKSADDIVRISSAPAVQEGVDVSSGTPAAAQVVVSTQTSKIPVYQHLGSIAVGWKYMSLIDYYQESAYYLSYGRAFTDRLALGVNLKFLQEQYVMDDYLRASPVFDMGGRSGVSAVSGDIGVLYNLAPRFFVGASVSDINQPNLGLMEQDQLPATGRLGIAWRETHLSWALDAMTRQNQWYYSTGFERFIGKIFGVRMGLTYGGRSYFVIAGGFGINLYRVQLDYVMQYPIMGLRDTSGTHRMAMTLRFGRKEKFALEPGSLEYYYSKLQDELANTAAQLRETRTEKENLEKILVEESTMRIRERIKAAKAEARGEKAAPVRQQESETLSGPREVKHVVQKNDTLQSIAEKYYGNTKFWNDIYQANKDNIGRGGVLKPGQVLIIPQSSNLAPANASDAGGRSGADLTPVKVVVPVPVTVGGAAPAASEPAAQPAGEITPIKIIPVKINTVPAAETPKAEAAKPAPQPAAKPAPRKHVVAAGENLRSIAQKYYGSSDRWKEIYRANRSKVSGGQVTPGQEITIP